MENDQNHEMEPARIAMSGATGLIGTELRAHLGTAGHRIHKISRSQPETPEDIYWQPRAGEIDAAKLEGVDVVVHLAGENIFGRWTASKKESILKSRVQGTKLLARTLAQLQTPPKVFVSASAVGYYGNSGREVVDESSPPGDTFLADVCQRWEAACRPAVEAGIRTVNTRFGVVLTTKGGALEKMLTPFKFGVGGRIGDGEQYMSWIALADLVRAVEFVIDHTDMEGPVNVAAPNPVTNEQFTETLGDVLNRPTIFPLPGPLVKLGAGQMGEEMLLHGQRTVPAKLKESGFEFQYPKLEAALRHVLAV